VRAALEAGIDAVVVGAGLPLDLPDLARDHPHAALVPIQSDARGVRRFEDIRHLQSLGAAAVQLGTPFVATEECDAHPNFKRVLADARDEDLIDRLLTPGIALGTPPSTVAGAAADA
jgi:NAD(P)H-dependent flavin oxidoreductase YrpB (nitropropane dioxygenase family)